MNKQQQNGPVRGTKRRSRRWLWVLGSLLGLILLILLVLPVFLSSTAFTRVIQAGIGRSTGGQAEIGDLSVGWLKGIRVADFRFRPEGDWARVDVERITTQANLGRLLTGTLSLDRTVVNQPRVAIDMRDMPPRKRERKPIDMTRLSLINEMVVRDGSVELTDTSGETVTIADIDSTVRMRPPGDTSRFTVNMVVADAGAPAQVQVTGQVTPARKTGWTFQGTSGDLSVEVNDLDLHSVAPFLRLAGVRVQAGGRVSANVASEVRNGHVTNLTAAIVGRDLDISGPALRNDRLQTAKLDIKTTLTQKDALIHLDQLNVQTDWATVSASGTVPATLQSLTQPPGNGRAYDLRGDFDVNLAAVLSQMPNTIGVREGVQVTDGKATGTIRTTTQAGRTVTVAQAQIVGLAGTVNGKKLGLSESITTALTVSSDKQGTSIEQLNVASPFATVNASGDFEQIKYDGQINLAQLRSELGSFVNLGPYEVAGQVKTAGTVSIRDKTVGMSGSVSAKQLVLTSADGNSVAEPTAQIDFAMDLDREQQALAVHTLTAQAGFGTVSVKDATIPLNEGSAAPMNVAVSARDAALAKLKPYAVLFAGFPKDVELNGVAQSQLTVTRQKGVYHLATDATTVRGFKLVSPEKEIFEQEQVAVLFDVYLDPNDKTINVDRLLVESPQIKIKKGEFRRSSRSDATTLQGTLEAECDWALIGRVASAYVPGELTAAGRRQISLNFASTYPRDEPNALLGNLDGGASLAWDRAAYSGLNLGSTQMEVRIENGLLTIPPVITTANGGQLRFAAEANLARTPILLETPAPLPSVQGLQINAETAQKLLRYVNPIFANAVGVSGIANFECQRLVIPLASEHKKELELIGTVSMDELRLGGSDLINRILSVIGKSVRGQVLTLRPTKITLRDGMVRYDDMQIDVGDNPVNFRGAIGLDGRLEMMVVLPYTTEGGTVRVGQERQAGERIVLPLTGTIEDPQLNLQDLLRYQLQQQLRRGFERLFK